MKLVPALKVGTRFDVGKHSDVGSRFEIGAGFEVGTYIEINISFEFSTSFNEIRVSSSPRFTRTLSLEVCITKYAMLTFLPYIASQEGNSVLV